MNEKVKEIRSLLITGQLNKINQLVQECLDEDVDPQIILNEGLLMGMDDIAKKWANGEAFIPEVLIGARCMNAAIDILEPYLVTEQKQTKGKVLFGTNPPALFPVLPICSEKTASCFPFPSVPHYYGFKIKHCCLGLSTAESLTKY